MMNVLVSILSIIFILLKCESESATPTKKSKLHTTFHTYSEYGNFENISIQDILSTGINGGDQVIEKFVTLIEELASNFDTYKIIKLSVDGFHCPNPKFFEIGLSNKSALFNKISASQEFNSQHDQLFTTSVELDLSGIGKIHVSLPPTIKINADIFIRSQEQDLKAMGNITYVMKSNVFMKQSYISNNEWNSESNIKQRLFYNVSQVELRTGIEDHKVIYKKLNSFISNIEPSLVNHLLKQLNAELAKRNATFSTFFKFMKPKRHEPTVISSVVDINNTFLSDLFIAPNITFEKLLPLSLYILQNLKPEFDQIHTLNHNLVIVEGLSNFTNIKTTFSYINNPKSCRHYDKTMIVRIKNEMLTGKFTWIYCIKANDSEICRDIEFLFKVNRAEIEIKIRRYCYIRSNTLTYCEKYKLEDPQIGINLKKIQIKTNLPDTYCEKMGKSAQNVLNEYLKLAIDESLKNSITKKINEKRSLYGFDTI